MEKKAVFFANKEQNMRYLLIRIEEKYYYVDTFYKGFITIFCPILVYFLKYPLIELNTMEAKQLLTEVKEPKTNYFWTTLLILPLGDIINDINIHISKNIIIIVSICMMLIGFVTICLLLF